MFLAISAASIGHIGIVMFLIFIIGLPFWALIDILRSNFQDNTVKLMWSLIVILAPFIGPVLYFSIGARQKRLKVVH